MLSRWELKIVESATLATWEVVGIAGLNIGRNATEEGKQARLACVTEIAVGILDVLERLQQ